MNDFIKRINRLIPVKKYNFKNNSVIIENDIEKYVVKKKSNNKNIIELNKYLNSRDFINYVPIVKEEEDIDIYEYVEDVNTPIEQKGIDIVNTLSLLHNKTTYFKEVSKDKYNEIYETINNNISYLQNYYEMLCNEVETKEFMKPSEYLFIKNINIINNALLFTKKELDEWYELVENKTKQRVCIVHNNISLDHYLKNNNSSFISWDKSTIDSPILDLIVFYKNEYDKIVFSDVFAQYLERYPLLEEEQKLFFIVVSLPPKIEFSDNIFLDCQKITNQLNYIFKSDELTRPYYASEEIEE